MSDTVLTALIATIAPTITSVAVLIISIQSKRVSVKNTEKILEVAKGVEIVHTTINSGLTVRLAEAKDLGTAEGKMAQMEIQKQEEKK